MDDFGLSVTTSSITCVTLKGKHLGQVLAEILDSIARLSSATNELTGKLAAKADKTYVDGELECKADKANIEKQLEGFTTRLKEEGMCKTLERSRLDIKLSSLAAKDQEICNNLECGLAKKVSVAEVDKLTKDLSAKLADKADQSLVEAELQKKANTADVDSERALKVDLNEIDGKFAKFEELLAKKADMGHTHEDLAVRTHMEGELAKKADKDHTHQDLVQSLALKTKDLSAKLADKADQSLVETELQKKANTADVDSERALKVDLNEIDGKVAKFEELLAKKADMGHTHEDLAVRTHMEGELAKKADKDHTHQDLVQSLALKVDKEDMEGKLALKVDKKTADARAALVDEELRKKAGQEQLSAYAMKVQKELDVALQEIIRFEASSAELTKDSQPTIQKVSRILKEHPQLKVMIEGHTGCKCIKKSVGSNERERSPKKARTSLESDSHSEPHCRAIQLSEDRANAVLVALQAHGCTNQFQHEGHGCLQRIGMAVKIFPVAGQ